MSYRIRLVRNRYVPLGLAALAACLFPEKARGQEPVLTLGECVSLAMEQNPLIRSAREQYQASLARVRQARAFPQPSLDIDSDLQPGVTDFSDYGERYIGISQTIPFPGRTYLQGRIAGRGGQSDQGGHRPPEARRHLPGDRGLLCLAPGRGAGRATPARISEFTEDFVQMTELKFEAGDVPQMELIRARVEAATAANQVRVAENEERLARASIELPPGTDPVHTPFRSGVS